MRFMCSAEIAYASIIFKITGSRLYCLSAGTSERIFVLVDVAKQFASAGFSHVLLQVPNRR